MRAAFVLANGPRLDGAQIRELARMFRVDRSTVEEHLRRQAVPKTWLLPGRMLGRDQLLEAGLLYQGALRGGLAIPRQGAARHWRGNEATWSTGGVVGGSVDGSGLTRVVVCPRPAT
jgi:DNA-binding transcriptional ArsR family regulator